MSALPAPAKRPKPAGHKAAAAYTSAEHASLLELAWANLEHVAAAVAPGWDDAAVATAIQGAIGNWQRERKACVAIANQLLADGDLDVSSSLFDKAGSAEAARKKFQAGLRSYLKVLESEHSLPAVPLWETGPRISERKLAHPLFLPDVYPARSAGFIDIQFNFSVLREITLESNVPRYLRSASRRDVSLWAASDSDFTGPLTLQWATDCEHKTVWLDIKPLLPPLGELLRDLKTLEGCAPAGVGDLAVVVLTNSAAATQRAMLSHEGFILLTPEDFQRAGHESHEPVGKGARPRARKAR